MIEPKFQFKNKDNNPLMKEDLFIDRIDERTLFLEFASNLINEYNILMYYGIGGVGKTRLLNQLIPIFKKIHNTNFCFHADLEDVNNRTVGELLLQFVDNQKGIHIEFDAFNLAYASYFSKKYAGKKYGRNGERLAKKYETIFNIIGIFDNGCIGTAVDIFEKCISYARHRKLDNYIIEDIEQFSNFSISEIENRLPAYFLYDIKRAKESNPDAGVLFTIDSFEALNINQSESIHRWRNESWIQDIIAYFHRDTISNCAFVITGRERLSWGKDWDPYIKCHNLKDFNSFWTKKYLNECQVTDENIISQILITSKGHPFYLYLSAKIYNSYIKKGKTPKISDFSGTYMDIISRFIYNLSDNEVTILKYMAIPYFFTNDIFKYVMMKYGMPCDPLMFKHIVSYSFIQEKEHDRFYIHSLMREGLLSEIDENMKIELNTLIYEYYFEHWQNSKADEFLVEMVYHAVRAKDNNQFWEWSEEIKFLDRLKELQHNGNQNIIFHLTDDLIKHFGIKSIARRIVDVYIDSLHLGGNYEMSVKFCNSYLHNFTQEEILKEESLLRMSLRVLHHSMFFKPVKQLIEESEKMLSPELEHNYPDQYLELVFLLGGNLGVLSGNFNFAEKWLMHGKLKLRTEQNDNHILRITRKLADICTWRGEMQIAIDSLKKYIPSGTTITKRYQIYAVGSLGEAYRKKGDLDKSELCFDCVKAQSKSRSLISWECHALLGLSMIRYMRMNYEESAKLAYVALAQYEKSKHIWGILNAKTILLLNKQNIKMEVCVNLDDCMELAKLYSYQYNVERFKELKETNSIKYFQLFFL